MPAENKENRDEWTPRPARLRKGETPDLSGHAQRNIEQIREGERTGHLSEEEAEEAVRRITERDQEVQGRD